MQQFEGQVVLVTGAAQGLGRAVAERLAGQGAALALCDVSLDGLKAVAEDIGLAGGTTVVADAVDVASGAQVGAWIERLVDRFGHIDALVNNAGVIRDARLETMTDEDWNAVLDVSLRGSFNCMRAVFPHMKAAAYGRIVSLSSMSWRGNFGQANYAAAKAGIVGLARTAALEGAPHGITSNVIAPGPIDTPMLASMKADVRDKMIARIPAGRMGHPRDIAAAATFLLSREAGFVTGVVVDVDGGLGVGLSLR